MRLLADRSVRHGSRGEPLHDRLDRLDLVDRHRRARALEADQSPQCRQPRPLVIDQPGVLLEDRVLPGPGGVLQLEYRRRVEQVVLALAPPLVLAAPVEIGLTRHPARIRLLVPPRDLFGDDLDADAADARRGPREVLVDEPMRQAERLENLRAAVALQRRDPHLGHHLEDALVQRLDVVAHRRLMIDAGEQALQDQVVQRLEGQIGIDHSRTVAEEQRAVVHLARVARLDHECTARARAFAHQVMVHPRRGEQARNRRVRRAHAAVGEDQDRVAGVHRIAGARAQVGHRPLEPRPVLRGVEQHRQRDRPEPLVFEVPQLGRFLVADDRVLDLDLPARLGPRVQQVALRADGRLHRRHQLLADGIERRVRHLREQLLEIVVEHARPVREHGQATCRYPSTRSAPRRSAPSGSRIRRRSSCVYPNACWRRSTVA